jgi:hypothetical protein
MKKKATKTVKTVDIIVKTVDAIEKTLKNESTKTTDEFNQNCKTDETIIVTNENMSDCSDNLACDNEICDYKYPIEQKYNIKYIDKLFYDKNYAHCDQFDDATDENIVRKTNQCEILKKATQQEQRTDEWYVMRKKRLTASDLGCVLGLNKYEPKADPAQNSNRNHCRHGTHPNTWAGKKRKTGLSRSGCTF